MKERNVTVTLDKAREWFNSGNATLREVALQAFNKDELMCDFRRITTFKEACEALELNYNAMSSVAKAIVVVSKTSAAIFKLNVIRKALNLGHSLYLVKNREDSHVYYPYNPFVTKSSSYYNCEISSDTMEIIGKIKSEGEEYYVLGGFANNSGCANLSCIHSIFGVSNADAHIGFLGCATKEIAQHLGKYFGMLITEAKYADIIEDFEIVESKYSI